MTCPKCRELALQPETLAGVTVDGCPRCHGVWLDAGELDALSTLGWTEVRSLAAGRLSPEQNQKRGNCPRDHSPLLRVYSALQRAIVLDRCGQCGGVWLDGGELRALLQPRVAE
jgi:uncharacterized protein